MDRACNTHEGDEKCIQNFSLKPGRENLEDLGVDGRIILAWI
jgi:hypothetical protein